MPENVETASLVELLHECGDRANRNWEAAWRELILRYKNYMYKAILRRCQAFNNKRLNNRLSTAVDDIFNEVIINLCKEECRGLRSYRGGDNERIFLSWLATICNMTTYTYVQKHYMIPLFDSDINDFRTQLIKINPDLRWQIFEDLVRIMRNSTQRAKNIERDISIFMLYVWADFSQEMLAQLPHLDNMGHRVVDDVVHRMRKILRQYRDFID